MLEPLVEIEVGQMSMLSRSVTTESCRISLTAACSNCERLRTIWIESSGELTEEKVWGSLATITGW